MFDEGFENCLGVASGDGDLNAWMVFEEAGDEAGEQILANGLRGGDGEASGGVSGGGGDGFAGFFGKSGESIGVGEQGFSSCGQRDPATAAIEECDREFRLQRFDLLGDGWLGEQEFLGGLAEVQVTGDGAKDAEAKIFHPDQSTASKAESVKPQILRCAQDDNQVVDEYST